MHIQKILVFIGTAFLAMVLFSSPTDAASHTVQKGDTLYHISKKYNTTVNHIKQLNYLKSDVIKVGQALKVSGTAAAKASTKAVTQASTPAAPAPAAKKTIRVTATAFTAYCGGCSGITSTGINLKKNPNAKVIAVDPRVIPLGTKVHVEGYGTAVAGDTGGAIKGNKIDVFYSTNAKAYQWGRRTVTVTFIN